MQVPPCLSPNRSISYFPATAAITRNEVMIETCFLSWLLWPNSAIPLNLGGKRRAYAGGVPMAFQQLKAVLPNAYKLAQARQFYWLGGCMPQLHLRLNHDECRV